MHTLDKLKVTHLSLSIYCSISLFLPLPNFTLSSSSLSPSLLSLSTPFSPFAFSSTSSLDSFSSNLESCLISFVELPPPCHMSFDHYIKPMSKSPLFHLCHLWQHDRVSRNSIVLPTPLQT